MFCSVHETRATKQVGMNFRAGQRLCVAYVIGFQLPLLAVPACWVSEFACLTHSERVQDMQIRRWPALDDEMSTERHIGVIHGACSLGV